MKITVLSGGPSAERAISLVSGEAVIAALRQAGHEVFAADIAPDDLAALDRPCDVVFPVLHGEFGESGELQEILELRNIPFVGSGSGASRLGMDKVETKLAWERAGLPTPPWQIARPMSGRRSAVRGPGRISAPCVVKAFSSGSSIDVFICKTEREAHDAIQNLISKYGQALVERYIDGPELTVAILEDHALSPIRITTSHAFFDYAAKYVGNDAKHEFDLQLPADLVKSVQELALRAHQSIGCRDLSRVDVMIDRATSQPFLLEINTMPGFTSKSLLPEAAAHDGVDFVALVDRLAKRAFERGPTSEPHSSAA